MTPIETTTLVGRIVTKDGLTYTVQSTSTYGYVCVWNPREQTLMLFDSRETFEHWAYGTPVPSAASSH